MLKKTGEKTVMEYLSNSFFFLRNIYFLKKKIIIGEKCQINLLELTNWLFS